MARVRNVRNTRVITLLLLLFTFILAGVAIFAAITLQNRKNVNPGDSSAGTCPICQEAENARATCEFYKQQNNGEECPWIGDVETAEAQCNTCQAQNNITPTTQDPSYDTACGNIFPDTNNQYGYAGRCPSGATPLVQVYCTDCVNNTPPSGATCDPQPRFVRCEFPEPSPTTQPTGTGDPNCNENNGVQCQCGGNICAAGSVCDPLNPFQCMPPCSGNPNDPACICGSPDNICRQGTNGIGPFTCGDVDGVPGNDQFECKDMGSDDFLGNEVCKYPVNQGPYDPVCGTAFFKDDCSPGYGEMCVCEGVRDSSGNLRIRNGYVYGTSVDSVRATDTSCLQPGVVISPDGCFAPDGTVGGVKDGQPDPLYGVYTRDFRLTKCGNTLNCPPPPNTTPTPITPTPITPTSTPATIPAQASVTTKCMDGNPVSGRSISFNFNVTNNQAVNVSGNVGSASGNISNITNFGSGSGIVEIRNPNYGGYTLVSNSCNGQVTPGQDFRCELVFSGCQQPEEEYAACVGIELVPSGPYSENNTVAVKANTFGANGATYAYKAKIVGGTNTGSYGTKETAPYTESRNGTQSHTFPTFAPLVHADKSQAANYTVLVEQTGGQTMNGIQTCQLPLTIPPQNTQAACVDMFIDGTLKDKVMSPGDEATMVLRVSNPDPTKPFGGAVLFNKDNLVSGAASPARVPNTNFPGFSELITQDNASMFKTTGVIQNNVGTYTWRIRYEQLFQNDANFNNQLLKNIQVNGYGGGSTGNASCMVNFATINPPICQDLEVSKTTDINQGDTLEVRVVSGGDNTGVSYDLDASFGNSNATQNPSDASRFTVRIPTDTSLESFTLQGSVIRDNLTSAPEACRFTYSFDDIPNIDKELDEQNSTNIDTDNDDYVIVNENSEVEYDITVRNDGENVMQNLIVVDYVEAFDPTQNNSPINPAIGDIKSATDLTRTTGTLSTPSPVAPRVPSGNGPYAVGTKRVEWNKINSLHPGEAYTGSVRVDVLDFTDTPMLRNNVCLYVDTNNNGQYDEDIDEELRCDHVDVYTGQPQFIVRKEAFELNSDTPAQVVEPGDTFTYRITVTNTSDTAINNITVRDTLDSTFISKFNISNISDGGQLANNIITWTIPGPLQAGESKVLTFNAQIRDDFFDGSEECSEVVRNDVQAETSTPDYTTPIYQIYITVIRRDCDSDFTIIKSVSPNAVAPSGTVTYTSSVTNAGQISAPIVRIVDDYPDSFTYISGSTTFTRPDGSTFKKDPEVSNGRLTWEFSSTEQVTLAPSQSMSFTYQMTASSTPGTYPNVICLENPIGGCDDAVVIVSVNPTAIPSITPQLPGTGFEVGDGVKLLGIGMLGLGILSYVSARRRSLSVIALSETKVIDRRQKSFDEKVKDIISRLKR